MSTRTDDIDGEDVRETLRSLRLVGECSSAVLRGGDEQGLAADVCRILVERGGCAGAWIGVTDGAGSVRPIALAGLAWPAPFALAGPHDDPVVAAAAAAVRSNAPGVVAPVGPEAGARVFALPLPAHEGCLGVLVVTSDRPGGPSAAEVEALREVAESIARGLVSQRERHERRKVEDELFASREMLRLVLDTIPQRVFWKDRDLVYVGCNKPLASDCGYDDPKDLVGKTDYETASAATADLYRADDRRVMETGQPKLHFEEPQIKPDGSQAWLITSKVPLRDRSGDVIGVLGTYEDITDRKNAELERARLEAVLLQSQKMESVGLLAGGIAHDFNNLLTPILGYSELLLADLGPGDARSKELRAITMAAELARDLTRQLLAFSRKQVLELKLVDLCEVVEMFAPMLRRTIRENIQIDVRVPTDPVVVKADRGQLEQVLLNLAVNAQDAMPRGGHLAIDARSVDANPSPGAGGGGSDRSVVLVVSDTGAGMSAETMPHIFEPFYTTKEHGKGTGLGLSTVYGIVKQHGGTIAVDSEPGRGTTFTIALPRAPAGASKAAAPEPSGPVSGRELETILVVEDDQVVRELVCTMLRRIGYSVLSADGPESCFALAERHRGRIDLLLADVIMPGMDGNAIYRRLRERDDRLKVLYMSGYPTSILDGDGALEEGTAFLSKPITLRALASKVREVLDSRLRP